MLRFLSKQKITLVYTFFFLAMFTAQAQNPFISDGPGEGLGQYGYLEVDATTHTTLNSNTHSNVESLAARWWTGGEFLYSTGNLNDCSSSNLAGTTANYNINDFTNANPGDLAFVSVNAYYCGGGQNLQYNERQFRFIDIEPDASMTYVSEVYDDGGNYLVGSFTLNAGSENVTLNRLYLLNEGTAQEGTHLPNDGIKLYYEAITGSETFDGTEMNQLIFGDYGGGSTSDNIYGHDVLNIAVPASGLRVYVVINNTGPSATSSSNSFAANSSSSNTTVNFSIINDGISIAPALDAHDLLRVGQINVSNNMAIVLPVELASFQAQLIDNQAVQLDWTIDRAINNAYLNVQKYVNNTWQTIGRVETGNAIVSDYSYIDPSVLAKNYYRLEMVDLDGSTLFSNTVSIDGPKSILDIQVYPTLVDHVVNITLTEAFEGQIQIINTQGQILAHQTTTNSDFDYSIEVNNMPTGLYFVQIVHPTLGVLKVERIVIR